MTAQARGGSPSSPGTSRVKWRWGPQRWDWPWLCPPGLSGRPLCSAPLRGPALLPLGREKPAGGVSQRKRETKNSSPGEQAHFPSPSTPACSFTLGSGPEGPFLGLLVSFRPDPATPFSPYGTVDPGNAKGPRAGGLCSSGHPRQKVGASSAPDSDWGSDREHSPRGAAIAIFTTPFPSVFAK